MIDDMSNGKGSKPRNNYSEKFRNNYDSINWGKSKVSKQKKQIREDFRQSVFKRDGYKCRTCGRPEKLDGPLDAHHITDRNEMPKGGYVKENGITLCPACHIKAEQFHISNGTSYEKGFHPNDLYKLINSSKEKAELACKK